ATPQSVGKALVNLLPLTEGETITSILPLPEDEKTWGALELMFATRIGNVRRNSLADFESINRNGKIAMKLEEGDRIVRVAICRPGIPQDGTAEAIDAGAGSHAVPEAGADDEA